MKEQADLQIISNDETGKEILRREIIESIDAGVPVLAFGVVGPPEISIIAGYDQGGEVLIGWGCMTDGLSANQFMPNGMYKQDNWFNQAGPNNTYGIILLERAAKLEKEQVYREAVEWAYRVMTLPKSKTHLFGLAAYKGWAERDAPCSWARS